MRFNLKVYHFFILIISLFFFSGSEYGNYSELKIKNPYAISPLEGMNTFAAYMSLTNISNENISIIEISCSNTKKAFLHDMKMGSKNGMISMEKIDSLIIGPRETIHLKPRGKHVMIVGLSSNITLNDEISCLLGTRRGKNFPVSFKVR